MADNLDVTPGTGATMAADEVTINAIAVKVPRAKISIGAESAYEGDVSSALPMPVRSMSRFISMGSFTRPGDTTAYTVGDLVANSTTAGSVVALSGSVALANDIVGRIRSVKLTKSTNVLNGLAIFRIYFYSANPAFSNGDNGANVPTLKAIVLGSIDVTMVLATADGAWGIGSATYTMDIPVSPATGTQTVYASIEARAAYTPGNAEVFTLTVEVE